ncbi:MAG: hypothetical protein AVDCRST_MAG54-1020, partial [uncultured Actinomycetospora sp.]
AAGAGGARRPAGGPAARAPRRPGGRGRGRARGWGTRRPQGPPGQHDGRGGARGRTGLAV